MKTRYHGKYRGTRPAFALVCVLLLCAVAPAAQAMGVVLEDEALGLTLRLPAGWQGSWAGQASASETIATAQRTDGDTQAVLSAQGSMAVYSASMFSERERARELAQLVADAEAAYAPHGLHAGESWVAQGAQTPFFCVLLEGDAPMALCQTLHGGTYYLLTLWGGEGADVAALRAEVERWVEGFAFDAPAPTAGDHFRFWVYRLQSLLSAVPSEVIVVVLVAAILCLTRRRAPQTTENSAGDSRAIR